MASRARAAAGCPRPGSHLTRGAPAAHPAQVSLMPARTTAAAVPQREEKSVDPDARANAAVTLLERGFPFRELSLLVGADRRGRDPSYGVHRWWARRPPALVRGVLLAAFTPSSRSRTLFWKRFADPRGHLFGKRIHDPFLGGGSTVVEAARLGAAASGSDIDPLACMIARHELSRPDVDVVGRHAEELAKLLCERLAALYQAEPAGWTPLHWFWISVVECPQCSTRTPLYRSLVIARDLKKAGAVVRDSAQVVFCPDCFAVHQLTSKKAKQFYCCGRHDVRESTFRGLKFHCPSCACSADHTLLKTLSAPRALLAVEETHASRRRRIRGADKRDQARADLGSTFLTENQCDLLLPEGHFATPRRDARPISYGASRYVDLFCDRQLATFGLAFRWIQDCAADDHVKEALMLAASHALAFNNRLCGYATDYGRLTALFSVRSYCFPALSVELNPLHPSAGRGTLLRILRERILEARNSVRRTVWNPKAGRAQEQRLCFADALSSDVRCASALAAYPTSERFDFSFFDPPYFDYIAYSELSEFYRGWLNLGEVGGMPLLPDAEDPVRSFSTALAGAISALRGKLRADAPFAFTFHSSSASAWRAIREALRLADERVTALWPVLSDPRMGHHGGGGSCEWDLVLVCRPARACRASRAPSVSRWRRVLRPLRVSSTDQRAFQVALAALRGMFGKPVLEGARNQT